MIEQLQEHTSWALIYSSQPYPLHKLWEFQQQQLFTDIDVVCGTFRIGCHRFLLSMVLPWLIDLDSDLLVLPDLNSEALLAALQPLYASLNIQPLRSLLSSDERKNSYKDSYSGAEDADDTTNEESLELPPSSQYSCAACGKLRDKLRLPGAAGQLHQQQLVEPAKEQIMISNELAYCSDCSSEVFNHELPAVAEVKSETAVAAPPPVGSDLMPRRTCGQCGKRYSRQSKFQQHLGECGSRRFFCEACGQDFKSQKNLSEHKVTHSEQYNTFRCSECHKVCATRRTLRDHLKWHEGIPKVGCPICSKQLSSESTLHKHMSSVHQKIRRYACQHCPHRASTPGNLQQHIDSFHLGIKHECDICQEFFASKASLYTHRKSHSDERLFTCPECGQSFKSKRNLQVHIRGRHSVQDFQCQICSKIFKSQDSLDYHMKYHNPAAQLPCTICDKRFVTRTKLNQHINTHTGEKPYKCPHTGCNKAFPASDQLSHHKKTCQKAS